MRGIARAIAVVFCLLASCVTAIAQPKVPGPSAGAGAIPFQFGLSPGLKEEWVIPVSSPTTFLIEVRSGSYLGAFGEGIPVELVIRDPRGRVRLRRCRRIPSRSMPFHLIFKVSERDLRYGVGWRFSVKNRHRGIPVHGYLILKMYALGGGMGGLRSWRPIEAEYRLRPRSIQSLSFAIRQQGDLKIDLRGSRKIPIIARLYDPEGVQQAKIKGICPLTLLAEVQVGSRASARGARQGKWKLKLGNPARDYEVFGSVHIKFSPDYGARRSSRRRRPRRKGRRRGRRRRRRPRNDGEDS